MATYSVHLTTQDSNVPKAGAPKESIQNLINVLKKLKSGHTIGTNSMVTRTAGVAASGTVTAASVQVNDTVTINGQALTAKQWHAKGTVTTVSANLDAGDTFTLNGVVFTAAAAEDLEAGEFNISGSNDATATSLLACIAASEDPLLDGFTATRAANVITFRAIAAGTAGNAYTLATTDADGAVISGATFTGGAAAAANQFECSGTNTETATSLATCIGAGTTAAAVTGFVTAATNGAAIVTVTAIELGTAGNTITLASSDAGRLACSVTRLAGGTTTNITYSF